MIILIIILIPDRQEGAREQTGVEEVHAGGEEEQPERGVQSAVRQPLLFILYFIY